MDKQINKQTKNNEQWTNKETNKQKTMNNEQTPTSIKLKGDADVFRNQFVLFSRSDLDIFLVDGFEVFFPRSFVFILCRGCLNEGDGDEKEEDDGSAEG